MAHLLGDPEQRSHHDVLSWLCKGPPSVPLRSAEVLTFANTLVFCQAPFPDQTPSPCPLPPSGSRVRALSPNVPQPFLQESRGCPKSKEFKIYLSELPQGAVTHSLCQGRTSPPHRHPVRSLPHQRVRWAQERVPGPRWHQQHLISSSHLRTQRHRLRDEPGSSLGGPLEPVPCCRKSPGATRVTQPGCARWAAGASPTAPQL